MIYLFFACIVMPVKDVCNKVYGNNFGGKRSGLFLHNAVAMFGASLLLLAINLCTNGRIELISTPAMILALAFGVFYYFVNGVMVEAMTHGPMGLTSIVCGAGGIISGTLFGIFACGDAVTAFNISGATLLMISMLLITPFKSKKSDDEKDDNGGKNAPGLRWFIWAFASALMNAFLSIAKKAAVSMFGADGSAFAFWSFFFAALTGIIVILFFVIKGERFEPYLKRRVDALKFLPVAVAMGLAGSLSNTFQMLILSEVPSIIVFPIASIVPSVINGVLSACVFKDQKMTLKLYIAYVICFAGVVLSNL